MPKKQHTPQSWPTFQTPDPAKAWRVALTIPPDEPIWQWAGREVDFSRVPAYDTPIHGAYDPDYMPFWKEPLDAIQDDSIREIVVLKNSRAGYSENMTLIPLRWIMAQSPARCMYLTGDQTSGERYMQERIKRGMKASEATARALRGARQTEHEIQLSTMDFRVSWPRAKLAFKQDGWEVIFCDEVDTWPEWSADMARKRCDTYPFHKLIFGSSIDPARRGSLEASPILSLYRQTDQREWQMTDPETGNPFRFVLGGEKTAHGIKWDAEAKKEDGTWDLEKVRQSAHYVTPDGTRIDEADRMRVFRGGKWQATADGVPGRVGYKTVQPMVPFASGAFGEIAAAFLSAKDRGNQALRTYFAEFWGEVYVANQDDADENAMIHRVRDYESGEYFFIPEEGDQRYHVDIMTVDVHRDWLQWVVRRWREPGESALIKYGEASDFEAIEKERLQHGNPWKRAEGEAAYVFVDNHYDLRRMEVLDYCAQCVATALLGDDNLSMPYLRRDVDPYEGTRKGGGDASVQQYTWNVHEFRSRLLAAMRGESRELWAVYKGIDRKYVRDVTSTELKDGKWGTKYGQSQDHIFDCEVMQFVAAAILGVCR